MSYHNIKFKDSPAASIHRSTSIHRITPPFILILIWFMNWEHCAFRLKSFVCWSKHFTNYCIWIVAGSSITQNTYIVAMQPTDFWESNFLHLKFIPFDSIAQRMCTLTFFLRLYLLPIHNKFLSLSFLLSLSLARSISFLLTLSLPFRLFAHFLSLSLSPIHTHTRIVQFYAMWMPERVNTYFIACFNTSFWNRFDFINSLRFFYWSYKHGEPAGRERARGEGETKPK